jgi:SnoaL-like domain
MEQEFVQRFTKVWKNPSPEELMELLHPDVVLYQPHLPAIRGREAALEEFQRLFRWLPELYGEVKRSSGSNGVVFIEWQMKCPIGKQGVAIRAVDRFILQDGLGIERVAYFNQLPLVASVLTHPQVWSGFWQYRWRRKQRGMASF